MSTSYRLTFIDNDESFSIPSSDSQVKGYMVVRAPKGTAKPMYFPAGSAAQIHAMIGAPVADWADIQDLIDYNNQFGVYVSAPAGSDTEYPSYHGGVYFTKQGIFPFLNVADKESLNFDIKIGAGRENDFTRDSADIASFGVNLDEGASTDRLLIKLNSDIGTRLQSIRVLTSDGYQTLSITGDEVFLDQEKVGDLVTITSGNVANYVADGISVVEDDVVFELSGTSTETPLTPVNIATNLIEQGADDLATWEGKIATRLEDGDVIEWVADVEDIAYAAILQKSPTEKKTYINVNSINYDQSLYDVELEGTDVDATTSFVATTDIDNTDDVFFCTFNGKEGIYQAQMNGAVPAEPIDVTDQYKEKTIRIGTLIEAGNALTTTTALIDKLFKVDASGTVTEVTEAEVDGTFNTITFEVSEEVYPGRIISGGTFTGSLSETGRDSFGSRIYFPEVLPDEAYSFVEIQVFKTLDEDVVNGFFTGYKDIDPKVSGGSVLYSGELLGQRYTSKIVADLLAAKTAGNAPVSEFTPILKEGWTEAYKAKYDEAYLFLEPTGIESLKEDLFALRSNVHNLATFVAPKLLSAAEALDVNLVGVTGRITGFAQIVNEFQRVDSYTGKKYWSNLVGAYGTKLAKIMQDKYGGVAPMWQDITGGYGGEIDISVLDQRWNFEQTDLRALDSKGLNPIVIDAGTGTPLVLSHKTTQNPSTITDWSYLGHSMSFDLFKREVRDNVMAPQIGKPVNDFYFDLRQRQTEAILNRRIGGNNPIWSSGSVQVRAVNNDASKAARKFRISVRVKVTTFSEEVELTFTNIDQFTEV